MATRITLKVDLAVEKGPSSTLTRELDIDAYDLLKFTVPAGDNATPGTITVDVQPGQISRLEVLSITSTLYSDLLTYKIDGAGGDVSLDAPHLFVGGGAVQLLGATAKQFVFTNRAGTDKPASVQILVGRNAVP